jgi:hypothetical protein
MPVTVPAHQAVVLPLKIRWPRHFDGTALCVGAASPDLLNAFVDIEAHRLPGAALVALPLTLAICWALRRGCSAGAFAQLPDAGPLRLHSYRVLGLRRPAIALTACSAALGVASHLVVDSFTHRWRWGSNWLGLNEVVLTLPVKGPVAGAQVLQYAGHVLGSLAALAMFAHIGRRRLVERWYGAEAVAAARSFALTPVDRLRFWSVVAAFASVSVVGGGWAGTPELLRQSGIFAAALGGVVGMLVMGVVVRPVSALGAAIS